MPELKAASICEKVGLFFGDFSQHGVMMPQNESGHSSGRARRPPLTTWSITASSEALRGR